MTGVPKSVREAMIEAAWLLIAERGLEGMSTREVLARTGAPRGSVYHHFPRRPYGADRARHRPLPAVDAGADRRD